LVEVEVELATYGSSRACARFDWFQVDLSSGELFRSGVRVPIQEQPLQVLRLLLEADGKVVTREDLRAALWPEDTFVDFEHGVNTAVKKLRQALEDSAERPNFVETLPKFGYRFIIPVEWDGDAGGRSAPPSGVPIPPPEPAPVPQPIPPEGNWKVKARLIPSVAGAEEAAAPHRRWPLTLAGVFALLLVVGILFWFKRPQRSPAPEMRLHQLTTNSSENPVGTGAISPDEKYLAYSDLKGIHIKLIETGETQTTPQLESFKDGRVEWGIACWFPDSTRFLANLNLRRGQHPSIWTVSVLGGTPRKLRDEAEAWSISRDGSLIAFATNYGSVGPREIWLMGPNGEQQRKLFDTDENSSIGGAQFSPDGQRLVYFKSPEMPGKPGDAIQTRDLKGGVPPTTLVSSTRLRDPRGWERDRLGDYYLGFLDRGLVYALALDKRLIYVLAEDGNEDTCNYWEMPIDPRTGKPTDNPRRLTNWAGVCLGGASVTADGKRLAFMESTHKSSVYVAGLEGSGMRIASPSLLTLSEGENMPVDWTADSRAVIFASNRNGHWGIFSQSLDTDTAESIVSGPEDAVAARVSPDGAWVLYLTVPKNAEPSAPKSLMRAATTGGPAQLVLVARLHGYRCAKASATLCVFCERTPDRKQLIFTALDPLKGRGRELARFDADPTADYDWDLSPDASFIDIRKNREPRLSMLSLSGQEPRELVVKGWSTLINLDWAANGKGLFTSGPVLGGSVLLYVDLQGIAHPLWEQRGSLATWAIPSPDGRHLALSALTRTTNFWMLENF
jgi:Tol biopolymer transport system component/DNA-binding winged helix-turn-helix (wHTH) protein